MAGDDEWQVAAEAEAHRRLPEVPRVLSEQQFFALRAELDQMSPTQLAAFRARPENKALLERYDAHARRVAIPYLLALSALLLVSLATGLWLAR